MLEGRRDRRVVVRCTRPAGSTASHDERTTAPPGVRGPGHCDPHQHTTPRRSGSGCRLWPGRWRRALHRVRRPSSSLVLDFAQHEHRLMLPPSAVLLGGEERGLLRRRGDPAHGDGREGLLHVLTLPHAPQQLVALRERGQAPRAVDAVHRELDIVGGPGGHREEEMAVAREE